MDYEKMRNEFEQLILNRTGANQLDILQQVQLDMMMDKLHEYHLSREMLKEEGMTIESDNRSGKTVKASPAIGSSDLTMKAVLLLAKEIGLAHNNQSVSETKAAVDGGYDPYARPGK